jgi:acyl-CoA thioester hydrolase
LYSNQPFELVTLTVAKSQTNIYGHLRASEYVKLFDEAVPVFFTATGLADGDLKHGETTPFLMDLHACYLSELGAGEVVKIAAHHLGHDAKRARLMLTMHAVADGRLAGTVELLLINMGIGTRKPAAWSAEQEALWAELKAAHASLPVMPQAGRAIGAI